MAAGFCGGWLLWSTVAAALLLAVLYQAVPSTKEVGLPEAMSLELAARQEAGAPSCLDRWMFASCSLSTGCAAPDFHFAVTFSGPTFAPGASWSMLQDLLKQHIPKSQILFEANFPHMTFAYSCCSPGEVGKGQFLEALRQWRLPSLPIRLYGRVVCSRRPSKRAVYLALVPDHASQLRLFEALRSFEARAGGVERRNGLFHLTLMQVSSEAWTPEVEETLADAWANAGAVLGEFLLTHGDLNASELLCNPKKELLRGLWVEDVALCVFRADGKKGGRGGGSQFFQGGGGPGGGMKFQFGGGGFPGGGGEPSEPPAASAPAQERDSQEWHGSGWGQRQWSEASRDWDSDPWGGQQTWSTRDWHNGWHDRNGWDYSRSDREWRGTSDSTKDSDHGSDGTWYDRRCSSADGYWTSSTRTRREHEANQHDELSDHKKATLSERMAVPSFSADSTGDDLGASARSYLRQVDAWIKVTRAPRHQQALLLYQHLQGRAWVESEELSVEAFASDNGVQIFRQWVQDRYQEVEVSKVAEALTYSFRKLKRGQHQSIREFNSLYDRAHTRLLEIDCRLPEVARAWAYLNGLGLSHSEELGVLASVNNDYNTSRLQRAAILHEKSLKGPWAFQRNQQGDGRRFFAGKNTKAAFVTEHAEDSDPELGSMIGDDLPEEDAVELHEAFMAQESAKAKFREIAKARGINPEASKGDGKSAAERLQVAKSRSFCSGCKRRGHWHRDAECPLNQGRALPERDDSKGSGQAVKENYVVHVAYEVGDDGDADHLYAITDCACSKTVAGQRWIQNYIAKAKRVGWEPQLIPCDDEFRFGASKLFKANYTATVAIQVGSKSFMVRAAVVSGDVPLLLSRHTLGKLGMVYDIENHRADFKKLNIENYKLCFTSSGHPSLPVSPSKVADLQYPDPQEWGAREVIINSVTFGSLHQFTTCGVGRQQSLSRPSGSAGPFFRKQPPAPSLLVTHMSLPAPPKSVWQMTKAELIKYGSEIGVTLHSTWTVPEIRAIIQERRANTNPSQTPKGLGNMTLAELKTKAAELRVNVKDGMGKGEIIRVIRDFTRAPDEEVVTFGRFRNFMYKDVPESYLQWAMKEVAANTGASDDLKRLAGWAATRGENKNIPPDPEDEAVVPYHPETDAASSMGSVASWSVLDQKPLPATRGYAKAKAMAPSTTGAQELDDENGHPARPVQPRPDDFPAVEDGREEQSDSNYEPIANDMSGSGNMTTGGQCGSHFGTVLEDFYKSSDAPGRPIGEGADYAQTDEEDHNDNFLECYETQLVAVENLENKAKDLRIKKIFDPYECQGIVDTVCQLAGATPRRTCQSRGKTVILGAFVHGGVTGITSKTFTFGEVARYLNAYLKYHHPNKAQWTSLSLNKGNMAGPHRDSHNHVESYNLTTSFGQKSGGRLWVEEGQCDGLHGQEHPLELKDDKALQGIFVDTKNKVVSFHPRRRHFVEAWTGERFSVTAYSVRSLHKLSREQRDLLRNRGFPITELKKPHDTHHTECSHVPSLQQDEVCQRPKKSVRKELWKKAGLLGSLLAVTIAAASSFLCEVYSRPGPGVSLQEVGGHQRTYEAAVLGYDVAEPMNEGCWRNTSDLEKLYENIDVLQPRVLWIHDDGTLGHDDKQDQRLHDAAEHQLGKGGTVVYQAPERARFWRSPKVLRLQESYTYRIQYDGGICCLWLRDDHHGSDYLENTPCEVYVNETQKEPEPSRVGAEAISFDKPVASHIRAALTRLHQNLGHPANADLTRHLRLAGADEDIIKIAKGMKCQVCDRNKRAAAPRPASLPTYLDFNQLVSVDVFHVFDVNRQRHEMLSVIDHGTTFHLVRRLVGHSANSFEKAFVEVWSNTFGSPACIAADLETGLQAGLAKYCEFAGVKLRASAGQAHWQQGTVERHGQWHQDILQKIIDEHSVGETDIDLAVTAANQAKNELRRRHGYSPCQAVFGKDPRHPEDLMSGNDDQHVLELMTADRRRQREVALRTAARIAFYRSQVDVKLRKSLIQRARVKKGSYSIGEMVCFYRLGKSGTTSKRGQWRGPGLILGNDGGNWWISYGGRCHLVAEEHMRPSTAEELGSLFSSRVTRNDLETLLFASPEDPDNYTTPDQPGMSEPGDHDMDPPETMSDGGEPAFEHDLPYEDTRETPKPTGGAPSTYGPEARRQRKKGRPAGTQPYEALMLKAATTERSKEKQYEKELPWRLIPPEQHGAFKDAEAKQIKEHIDHQALRMLSRQETEQVLKDVPAERVLNSRWAYKDKNYAKRRENKDLAWRPKARLIIGGHRDPDIPSLVTDAPTVSRLSVLVLMQILACHLDEPEPWIACAGDVNAAFLNGPALKRTLFMRQPRSGIQGMEPGTIFQVMKGIFGLPDSPRGWWEEVQRLIDIVRVTHHDTVYYLIACPLDPCVYYLVPEHTRDEQPQAYLCIHVDDLLVIGPRELATKLRQALSQVLPIEEWEENAFDYIGSHFEVKPDGVEVSQTAYAATRLFTVDIEKGQHEQEQANKDQIVDNQSLIGGLSWLAVQSRPDLQVSVSIAQQMQKSPSVEDLKFTNAASRKASTFKEQGLRFTKIDLTDPVLLVFHDSSWANVVPLEGEDGFRLTPEDHEKGFITGVPSDYQVRKAKRASTRVASQYGILILASDGEKINSGGRCNILDWKSSTAKRVCRSTFAAESIACCEGLEQGQYVRSVFMTLLRGPLQKVEQLEGQHLRCFTDCRSLFDHLHRVGVPRTPTDKRLAIDLAAIRQILHRERIGNRLPLQWVPTEYQLADVLTKPMCPRKWWEQVNGMFRIPFQSSS
ncbi:GIP [Symbiodinium microadriaticum]|nr:GIP [Symbiodinium microadriaticum]